MYPIDTAIVTACHSGQGGTGDVAILAAGNRMQLMPFAQIHLKPRTKYGYTNATGAVFLRGVAPRIAVFFFVRSIGHR